jgi:Tol biopolymer transport system component
VDARADIWAFGCVLHEMLTGRVAFAGETMSDTIAAVLTREPDLQALPASTPREVRRVIERCLRKDPATRLHHIADARIDLDEAASDEPPPPAAPAADPRRQPGWAVVALAAAIAAGLGALAAWWQRPQPPTGPRYSFTITGAGFNTVSRAAISHDGRWIAYAPNLSAAPFKLMIRSLESFGTRELASSADTNFNPFFSPDDLWVAYFAGDTLFKVPVTGGTPQRIATLNLTPSSGAWTADGTVVLSNLARRALSRLPPAGGALTALTTVAPGETHLDPAVTPDGRTVLFTIARAQAVSIAAIPIDGSAPPRVIVGDGRTPQYSATGHLLYQRSTGELMAVRFDPVRAEVAGEAVQIATPATLANRGAFAAGGHDTLIFTETGDAAEETDFTLVTVDRKGQEQTVLATHGLWASPRWSPDGNTLAFRLIANPNCEIWALDVARGTRARVTFAGDNHDPVYARDGRLSWGSLSSSVRQLQVGRPDRPSDIAAVAPGQHERLPESWSPDGSRLIFVENHPASGGDLWVYSAATGEARPLVATPFNERHAAFSPDGAWVAYTSDESGRDEVYLLRADGSGGRMPVSANGGSGPLWSTDGRELFFQEGTTLMGVAIDLRAAPPSFGAAHAVVRGPYVWERPDNYDLSPDGQRFVFVKRSGADAEATLRVILNWPSLMRP